jgi:hypothetical protein
MAYAHSTIKKMEDLKNGNYSSFSITKNKYTVKGGVIGAVAGIAMAMYFKKSIFAAALLGTIAGMLTGNIVGNIILKIKNKNNENE